MQWILVEICNVCTGKVIIKAAKSISNSGKICHSYCDFYFGVTFFCNTLYVLCNNDYCAIHKTLKVDIKC